MQKPSAFVIFQKWRGTCNSFAIMSARGWASFTTPGRDFSGETTVTFSTTHVKDVSKNLADRAQKVYFWNGFKCMFFAGESVSGHLGTNGWYFGKLDIIMYNSYAVTKLKYVQEIWNKRSWPCYFSTVFLEKFPQVFFNLLIFLDDFGSWFFDTSCS